MLLASHTLGRADAECLQLGIGCTMSLNILSILGSTGSFISTSYPKFSSNVVVVPPPRHRQDNLQQGSEGPRSYPGSRPVDPPEVVTGSSLGTP